MVTLTVAQSSSEHDRKPSVVFTIAPWVNNTTTRRFSLVKKGALKWFMRVSVIAIKRTNKHAEKGSSHPIFLSLNGQGGSPIPPFAVSSVLSKYK